MSIKNNIVNHTTISNNIKNLRHFSVYLYSDRANITLNIYDEYPVNLQLYEVKYEGCTMNYSGAIEGVKYKVNLLKK